MLWLHLMGIAFAFSGIAIFLGLAAAPWQAAGFALNAWILARGSKEYRIPAIASVLLSLEYLLSALLARNSLAEIFTPARSWFPLGR
jgi:hypothetical protein